MGEQRAPKTFRHNPTDEVHAVDFAPEGSEWLYAPCGAQEQVSVALGDADCPSEPTCGLCRVWWAAQPNAAPPEGEG